MSRHATSSGTPPTRSGLRAGKSSFSGPDQIRPWASGSPLPPMLNVSVRSRGAGVWLWRRQQVSTFYQPLVASALLLWAAGRGMGRGWGEGRGEGREERKEDNDGHVGQAAQTEVLQGGQCCDLLVKVRTWSALASGAGAGRDGTRQ